MAPFVVRHSCIVQRRRFAQDASLLMKQRRALRERNPSRTSQPVTHRDDKAGAVIRWRPRRTRHDTDRAIDFLIAQKTHPTGPGTCKAISNELGEQKISQGRVDPPLVSTIPRQKLTDMFYNERCY